MYLIARLNLAMNEQSEKFWYGINDKASIWVSMGKNWGNIENLGRLWVVG